MNGRSGQWALALLGALGPALFGSCKPAAALVADAPADVEWIALLTLDASGALIHATPLARWSPGAALPVVTRGDGGTLVVGWTTRALADAGAPLDDAALLREPLIASAGCAPSLPSARWAASWTGDALSTFGVGGVPRLGAAWLGGLCPSTTADRLSLDVGCLSTYCERRVTATGPCTFDLDATECGIGVIGAVVDRSGAVCLDFTRVGWTCARRADDTTSNGPYLCTHPSECALDAYVAPEGARPPFSVDRVRVAGGEVPYIPRGWERRALLSPERAEGGYVYDLALIGDRAVVSVVVGPPDEECTLERSDQAELRIVDLETMATVATVPARTCYGELLAVPGTSDFLATSLDEDGVWRIERFDREGARVRTGTIAEIEPPQPWVRRVEQLAWLADGRVGALFRGTLATDTTSTTISVHDLDTLAQVDRIELPELRRSWVIRGYGERTLVLSHESRTVGWLDPRSRRFTTAAILQFESLETDALLDGVWHEPSQRIVVVGAGLNTLFTVAASGEVTRHTTFADGRALVALAEWPPDDALLFVTGTLHRGLGDVVASATFFDTRTRRFLPGTYELGDGTARRIQRDAEGRLWMILPWGGELLRLTPERR